MNQSRALHSGHGLGPGAPFGQPTATASSLRHRRAYRRVYRRVAFSETSEAVAVLDLSRSPYKRDLWFAPDELVEFKANMVNYVKVLRFMIRSYPAHHKISASYVLGLEKLLTAELTEEYKARREALNLAIIGEYRDQERRGRVCPDRLARVSTEHSEWARDKARAAALFLQQDQQWSSGLPPVGEASAH